MPNETTTLVTAPVLELVENLRKAAAKHNRAQLTLEASVRARRVAIVAAATAGMPVADIATALHVTRTVIYDAIAAENSENKAKPKRGHDDFYTPRGRQKRAAKVDTAEVVELTAAAVLGSVTADLPIAG